jgi:hypothetical protein
MATHCNALGCDKRLAVPASRGGLFQLTFEGQITFVSFGWPQSAGDPLPMKTQTPSFAGVSGRHFGNRTFL